MSINHALEAQRCLSKASWMTGNGPRAKFADPQSAAVLASLAQAHATLAHLPGSQAETVEQLRKARRDLDVTQRVVGDVIAETIVDGPSGRAKLANALAYALRVRGVGVDGHIENRMEGLGHTYSPDVEVGTDTVAETPARVEPPDATLGVVVEHLLQMSTSWEPELRKRAHQLMRDLDEAGVNIDRLVDECSAETGRGPGICDMLGHRYDLTKQWVDRRGKRWEHTGSWSDVGGPVMHRDEPDGDSLVLSELIREYGPLYTLAVPPKAPVVNVDCPF